jgi:hypothetical protein
VISPIVELARAGLEFAQRAVGHLIPMSFPSSDVPTPALARGGDARYQSDPDAAAECVADGMILVHLVRGTTFRLNHTGKVVWELAKIGRTQAEIVAQMQATWDVPAARLNSDVSAILQALVEARLLEQREETR